MNDFYKAIYRYYFKTGKLNFKYNKNGFEFADDLNFYGDVSLIKLPNNLKVDNNLSLYGCTSLVKLPTYLTVGGNLNLRSCTALTKLPNNLRVEGNLYLIDCVSLTKLPTNLTVGGNLNLSNCIALTQLPDNLQVGNNLNLYGCIALTQLPDNLKVGNYLNLGNCTSLTKLSTNLEVGGDLYLDSHTSLTKLPDNLKVGGEIFGFKFLHNHTMENEMSYKESMIEVIKATGIPEKFTLSSPDKISVKDQCAFSLPAGPTFSCPGATAACENCYATKRRHCFQAVQKSFARNWRLLQHFERESDMVGAVNAIINVLPTNGEIFRIHESGDFHSQFAVDMWNEVVKKKNSVKFWAYTRSFDLDFSKLLENDNFTLFASTDDFNIEKAKAFVQKNIGLVKHAYGPWDHDKELPEHSFVCPVTSKKMEVHGACEKCKLCVIKGRAQKNVVFLKH